MRKCGFALFFPVIYATFITFGLALQRKTLAFPEIFWHYPQTVNIICSMRWTWFLCVSLHFFFSMIYSLCFAFFGSWNFIFHQPQCWFRSPFCRLDIFMIFSILLWETGLPESKAFNHYFLPLTWKVSGSGETLCLM